MANKGICENPSKDIDFNKIPDDVLLEIFGKLDYEDLCRISKVCRRWYELSHSSSLRKKIIVRRCLKSLQFSQLVQHHFHKHLVEFQFLNGCHKSLLCNVKKKTFFNLRSTCLELKKLVLVCCSIKNVSLEDLPISLRYLSLRKSELNPYIFFKTCPQQYAPHLTCLDVGGIITFLTSEDLHIFTHLKNLRCLFLEGCFRINDGGIESMIDLIRHLEVLDVEGTDISNKGAQIIITNGLMLKKLYMGYTCIEDDVFEDFYVDLFSKLQNLCVTFTNISVEIIEKIKKNNGTKVKFSRNRMNIPPNLNNYEEAFAHFLNCNHYMSHSCVL